MKKIQDNFKTDPVIDFICAGQTLWTTLQPTFLPNIQAQDTFLIFYCFSLCHFHFILFFRLCRTVIAKTFRAYSRI